MSPTPTPGSPTPGPTGTVTGPTTTTTKTASLVFRTTYAGFRPTSCTWSVSDGVRSALLVVNGACASQKGTIAGFEQLLGVSSWDARTFWVSAAFNPINIAASAPVAFAPPADKAAPTLKVSAPDVSLSADGSFAVTLSASDDRAVTGFEWVTRDQLFEGLRDQPIGVQVAAPLVGLMLAQAILRWIARTTSPATADGSGVVTFSVTDTVAESVAYTAADISRIQRLVGYTPRYSFEDGVRELVAWVARQQAGSTGDAHAQLAAYGLVR